MTGRSFAIGAACALSTFAFLLAPACGSDPGSQFQDPNGSSGASSGSSGSNTNLSSSGGASSGGASSGSSGPCVGLQCQQVQCPSNSPTLLTGHIFDPAGNNPLYKVVAYVPNNDPSPITDGITSDSCSCDGLYTGNPIAAGITDATGYFQVPNAPVGTNIPIVIQIGKWRNYFTIPNVTQCAPNNLDTLLPAKLTLPKTQTETKFSNIPSIAVSTGGADTMECVFARIGVAESEYTGDPNDTTKHIHIFQGGVGKGHQGATTTNPVALQSFAAGGLWDTDPDINRYDIAVLSCEGQETSNPSSKMLADYVNGGGRVFASHYHYAFFFDDQANTATPEFPNVADWTLAYQGATGGTDSYPGPIGAIVQTTLANGQAFPEGAALNTWLGSTLKVYGTNGVPATDLEIDTSRYDGVVGPKNVSTVWAASDPNAGGTPASSQYFSWDMPFSAPLNDAGVPGYCGRVVFSDLHVGAAANDYGGKAGATGNKVPSGCSYPKKLQPDEDAIEFILFDLSSCVTPVSGTPQPPPTPGNPPK